MSDELNLRIDKKEVNKIVLEEVKKGLISFTIPILENLLKLSNDKLSIKSNKIMSNEIKSNIKDLKNLK